MYIHTYINIIPIRSWEHYFKSFTFEISRKSVKRNILLCVEKPFDELMEFLSGNYV